MNNSITDDTATGPIMEQETEEELEKTKPDVAGEESALGDAPNPEKVYEKDTLETAQSMGLYEEGDEAHQPELGIAEQINKAEEDIWDA